MKTRGIGKRESEDKKKREINKKNKPEEEE